MKAFSTKINICVTPAQKTALQVIADHWQISLSDFLRMAADDYARRNFPDYPGILEQLESKQREEVLNASTAS